MGSLHHPFWLQLVLTLFGQYFPFFETTLFGQGFLMRVQYPKCAYGPYCLFNPIENGAYILVEVSFYISSILHNSSQKLRKIKHFSQKYTINVTRIAFFIRRVLTKL